MTRARWIRRSLPALVVVLLWTVQAGAADTTLAVGSKNFAENRLLAEVFAQLIEARTGLTVERRLNLAGTKVCFEALRTGAIDLYPEYTGTGLVTLLELPAGGGPEEALRTVRREFLHRWDLVWAGPLGFENAYELGVRREVAEAKGLRTISDLSRISGGLTGGFGYEFSQRADGLPGLREVYGLEFAKVVRMQQALKYEAAGEGRVDVLDVYTTDGRLMVYDLVVLEDDLGFFPPYAAAPLIRAETLERHPEVASVLALLAGSLDAETMRGYNLRLQEDRAPVERVAQELLRDLGLDEGSAGTIGSASTRADAWALPLPAAELGRRVLEHLGLTLSALALGVLVAIPLGLLLERRRDWAESVLRGVGITQVIPSIALLAFMIPLLGVGALPAVVALWIYSLYPIARNTYTGVRDAAPEAVSAARALGMTEGQILRQVRLPLAAPVLMAGIRTSAVLTVGTATLAAFIGAGGLGVPIVTGLQLNDTSRVLAGAIPAALLALAVDGLLHWLESAVRPKGV